MRDVRPWQGRARPAWYRAPRRDRDDEKPDDPQDQRRGPLARLPRPNPLRLPRPALTPRRTLRRNPRGAPLWASEEGRAVLRDTGAPGSGPPPRVKEGLRKGPRQGLSFQSQTTASTFENVHPAGTLSTQAKKG